MLYISLASRQMCWVCFIVCLSVSQSMWIVSVIDTLSKKKKKTYRLVASYVRTVRICGFLKLFLFILLSRQPQAGSNETRSWRDRLGPAEWGCSNPSRVITLPSPWYKVCSLWERLHNTEGRCRRRSFSVRKFSGSLAILASLDPAISLLSVTIFWVK